MKVQMNDDKFSRTHCRDVCGDGTGFVPWTMAEDCTNGDADSHRRTSIANLEKTEIKFPENVESLYVTKSFGGLGRGEVEISSGGQQLSVESTGYCGTTYIPADQNNLLEVIFAS